MKILKTVDTVDRVFNGVTLKIARSRNNAHLAKAHRLRKPHLHQINNGSIDPVKLIELGAKSMAGTVLIGWDVDSLEAVTGERIAFSDAAAEDLLVNDRDCRDFVAEVSSEMDTFVAAEEDTLTGE